MERFAFIHGSSVGQSVFPSNLANRVCNDIADKYFKGRLLRQQESAAKQALFVEFYKSPKGDSFSIYSFVNNNCRGANGRDGQYLALTIICKNVYVYPESIFRMLSSAYHQMFATGKIIERNKEGEEQYIISQFSDESEYLSKFLKKIEDIFDEISKGLGIALNSNYHIADYNSWYGEKVNVASCNSVAIFESFCNIGRIYISEEYASPEAKIEELEKTINDLEHQKVELKAELEHSISERTDNVSVKLKELDAQIKKKDGEIHSLTAENKKYKTTIETVCGELEKSAELVKSITDIQNKKPQYQSKSKMDIIKICLLLIVLILTMLSSLASLCFFREISQSLNENKEMSENIYDFEVRDSDGNVLTSGAKVYNEQVIWAKVTNYKKSANFGWKYINCFGNGQGKNVEIVRVAITGKSGTAIIVYGDTMDVNKQQRFIMQIVDSQQGDDNAGN